MIFGQAPAQLDVSQLEHVRQQQLDRLWTSISDASSQSGVAHYLKFADRCGWDEQRILPSWDVMTNNIMLWMLDAVQTYAFRDAVGLVTKKAVTAKTLSTYMSHVNAWYSEVAEQPLGVTTQRKPKKLLTELTKALPQSNCQKNGFTADDMRGMLDSVQADGGKQCAMWEALFQLAWFGVLRPGECVPAGAFDASKHPTRSNIRFYRRGQRVHPAVHSDVMPTHMEFVVKYSKTDQDRLTQNVLVGRTNNRLCCVTAMWQYMCHTAAASPAAPLFQVRDATVTYRHLLAAVKRHSRAAGLNPRDYAGHSFRIGGSQALAAAGRSITYLMSYGRWRCTESVLRYVKTPLHIRMLDADHMASASTATRWDALEAQLREYYNNTAMQDKLWDARLMVA